MLNISGLNQGVVIDHIRAGFSMNIYEYLNLDRMDCTVAIIKNAKSGKMGKKDIIKIDTVTDLNFDILGVIAPEITINIIKDGVIVEKYHPRCPELVTGIIKCKNPRCVTSVEYQLPHQFKLTDPERGIYRCVYCEQKFKS